MPKRRYYSPKQPLSLDRPRDLYKAWLSGQSLRSLGGAIGCSHNTCSAVLKRVYGAKATNLIARSLERTLIQDYGLTQIDYAFKLATQNPEGDGNKHRSQHSIRELTKFQSSGRDHIISTVASLQAIRAVQEAEEKEASEGTFGFLRLPLYQMLIYAVQSAIYTALAETLTASVAGSLEPSYAAAG